MFFSKFIFIFVCSLWPYSSILNISLSTLSFNTLIATGYNAITILNDDELIKTNFDFASNNTDVLLDFNYDELTKLVNTNAGDKQEKLI